MVVTCGLEPSLSVSLSITVLASDFTLSATPPSLSIQTAHHLTFAVNVQSIGAFADTIGLSSNDLPAHMTFAFTPAKTTIVAGSQASVQVYLDTDDVIGYKSSLDLKPMMYASLFAAPLLFSPEPQKTWTLQCVEAGGHCRLLAASGGLQR